MQLAEDMGIKVECRPVPEEELETFEEAGACGTAAVISPIQRIDDLENNKSYVISKDGKPDRFVLSCTQSCVPFSMVMNLILITGLLFSINR